MRLGLSGFLLDLDLVETGEYAELCLKSRREHALVLRLWLRLSGRWLLGHEELLLMLSIRRLLMHEGLLLMLSMRRLLMHEGLLLMLSIRRLLMHEGLLLMLSICRLLGHEGLLLRLGKRRLLMHEGLLLRLSRRFRGGRRRRRGTVHALINLVDPALDLQLVTWLSSFEFLLKALAEKLFGPLDALLLSFQFANTGLELLVLLLQLALSRDRSPSR